MPFIRAALRQIFDIPKCPYDGGPLEIPINIVMQLLISGRHTQVTQYDKDLIEEKLAKYEKKLNGITKAEVVVTVNGDRRDMEVILHVPHNNPVIAKAGADTNAASLDLCIQKLDNHVSKILGKRNDMHKAGKPNQDLN